MPLFFARGASLRNLFGANSRIRKGPMVRKLGSFALVVLAFSFAAPTVNAQVESGLHARPRTTQSINEMDRVALGGNTHPEARLANDRGAVANDFSLGHMLLQLKRSPEQEKALQQFIDELHTKGSPDFHQWLTAQEFGERFGLAKPDLDAITAWLESHGFRVNVVYPSGMLIDFSGTAAQVRTALQTKIHYLNVKGEKHVGNISDPRIPAALAPVVAGIVSLHDFRPHAMHHLHKASPEFTFVDSVGSINYALVPADLATIYNLNPLFSASTPPPSIMSISYGQCETVNGAASNAAYNSAYQQAVTEGVSVFVSAGDSGAAGCDNSVAEATHGIAVNAFASTPNNVAVGGTDFSDTYSGTNTIYWNSSNTSAFGSAISYIPEIPWNDSCASALFSAYLGFHPTYGSTSLCNDTLYGPSSQTTAAGGGGPSQCASGAPSTASVVSGTCHGWPKPSWQSVLGNPNDGLRDTPDVSLFAADRHCSNFYIFCWSDIANGRAVCGANPRAWSGAGRTSFPSPIIARLHALINHQTRPPPTTHPPVS